MNNSISYQKGNYEDRKDAAVILFEATYNPKDELAQALLQMLAPMIYDKNERLAVKVHALGTAIRQIEGTISESEVLKILSAFEATWKEAYKLAVCLN